MAATYLYGIIPTGEQIIFDGAGVDDHHGEVYTVPYHGLAAVVSASPRADYRGLKRDQAVRYLVDHQRVVEAALQEFPVLPVKFGTVLPDEARVRRLLAQGETLFRTALERLAGRMQMEVVVLWDLEKVFREIGQEEPIARLKAQVAAQSPEESMAERIAVGQMVQASLERRRAALRNRLLSSFQEVDLDLVVNPLMDDGMVVNVALLVDQTARRALDWWLEVLDGEFEGRFHFRCVGPLPPYSFATVEVQVPSFEAVDEARCRLALGETATRDEIKRAYRRLAARLHPDLNPEDAEAEVHIAQLTQAYRFLTAYAEAVQGNGGPQDHRTTGPQDHRTTGPQDHSPGRPHDHETTRPPGGSSEGQWSVVSGQWSPQGGQRSVVRGQFAIPFSREVVERTLLIAIRRQEVPAQETGEA